MYFFKHINRELTVKQISKLGTSSGVKSCILYQLLMNGLSDAFIICSENMVSFIWYLLEFKLIQLANVYHDYPPRIKTFLIYKIWKIQFFATLKRNVLQKKRRNKKKTFQFVIKKSKWSKSHQFTWFDDRFRGTK